MKGHFVDAQRLNATHALPGFYFLCTHSNEILELGTRRSRFHHFPIQYFLKPLASYFYLVEFILLRRGIIRKT